MKERDNAAKEYDKTIKAAEALSKHLEEEIKNLRSQQAKFEGYKAEQERNLEAFEENLRSGKAKREGSLENSVRRYLRYCKDNVTRLKTHADAKTAEKVILDEAIQSVHQKLDHDVNTSNETFLAAAKHLNAMIDLIDPPFNYEKLPGMVLGILGSLSTLIGLSILIAAGTIAGSVLLFPLAPILFIGGAVVGAVGIMWYVSIAQNDPEGLKGCDKISQINDNQNFPSDDKLDKTSLYFKVEKDGTVKARWHENDGSTNGIIKTVHITDPTQCEQIIKLYGDKTITYFDELISLLNSSLTVQALNVEKAALATAIPTELVSPVDMPSSSRTSTTGTGTGLENTQSSTPFSEPASTHSTNGEPEKTATPQQQQQPK